MDKELDWELRRIIELLTRHFGREPTIDEVYIYHTGDSAKKRELLYG